VAALYTADCVDECVREPVAKGRDASPGQAPGPLRSGFRRMSRSLRTRGQAQAPPSVLRIARSVERASRCSQARVARPCQAQCACQFAESPFEGGYFPPV
jgi:hypothetical protein